MKSEYKYVKSGGNYYVLFYEYREERIISWYGEVTECKKYLSNYLEISRRDYNLSTRKQPLRCYRIFRVLLYRFAHRLLSK